MVARVHWLACHFPHQMVVSDQIVLREYDTLVEMFGLPLFLLGTMDGLRPLTKYAYRDRWGCLRTGTDPDPITLYCESTLYFKTESDVVVP